MGSITNVGVNILSDLLNIVDVCIKHDISVIYEINTILLSGSVDEFIKNCNKSFLDLRTKLNYKWNNKINQILLSSVNSSKKEEIEKSVRLVIKDKDKLKRLFEVLKYKDAFYEGVPLPYFN